MTEQLARRENARPEIAGPENKGPDSFWNIHDEDFNTVLA